MENILLYIINTLLIIHILSSIYVYLSILDKKKAGIIGIILSTIPILNIIIYKKAKEGNKLNDIEIIKQYSKDKHVYDSFLFQIKNNQMTMDDVTKQIEYDLKKRGISSIRDEEKSMALIKFIAPMKTTLLIQSKLKEDNFIKSKNENQYNLNKKEIKNLDNKVSNQIQIKSTRKINSMVIFDYISIITFLIIFYWYYNLGSDPAYNYIIVHAGILLVISLLVSYIISQLRKINSQIDTIKYINLYAKLSVFCGFPLSIYIFLFHSNSIPNIVFFIFIFSFSSISLSWLYDKFNE